MFIVESDNFSLSCIHPGLRFPSALSPESWNLEVFIVEVLFASLAVIYSCTLVYVLSGPLEIATLFVN